MKIRKLYKKAQDVGAFELARKQIFWMIIGFAISILVIALVFLISDYTASAISIPSRLETAPYIYRFYSSAICFAYYDPLTQRTDPGLIVLEEFTDQNLNRCYAVNSTKEYNFQLTLKNKQTNQDLIIKTEEWFNIPSYSIRKNVRIKDKDKIYRGELIVDVQKPW